MVSIANPIYDVVFKYLMEDSKVAKLLLSAIIGEEILSLDFRPQEYIGDLTREKQEKPEAPTERATTMYLYRLDFAAKIKTDDGEQLIIIELQKVRLLTDIMRFRRYLGQQYANPANMTTMLTEKGHGQSVGLPIIAIYILGEELTHIKDRPIVYTENKIYDRFSGEQLPVRETFIESLSHRVFVISIPALSNRRRDELEKILSIFDQSNIDSSHHILNISDEDFPEKYRPLIRRLQMAIADNDLRIRMMTEDDIMTELEMWEYEVALRNKLLREKDSVLAAMGSIIAEKDSALAEKESALAEKDNILAEKDYALAEKDNILAEKDSILAEKDGALAEKDSAIVEKDSKIAEKDNALAEKNNTLAEKENEIELLRANEAALKRKIEEGQAEIARKLLGQGLAPAQIAAILQVAEEQVDTWLRD